ncbi:MAG TPA: HAD family phosphatase [Candidatus Nocardiopsis merdipullorum]|nr:HAD family phosphatase [Candidatus Nocardiopsis merdipullorum]
MQAVLFDMFGVIARTQSAEGRASLERAAGVGGKVFWDAYWGVRHGYDRGDLDGPAYWRAVGERLGVSFDQHRVEELVALDLASWARLDQEMVDHVFALSESGVRLGLLSNIPHELADLFDERFPHLLALFPVLGLSCRIGSAKPEPDAFAWCLRGLELPAEQVLFVDDSERNVLAARDLGLGAHHFSSLEGLRAAMSGTN